MGNLPASCHGSLDHLSIKIADLSKMGLLALKLDKAQAGLKQAPARKVTSLNAVREARR